MERITENAIEKFAIELLEKAGLPIYLRSFHCPERRKKPWEYLDEKNKKMPDNQITVYQTPDGKINIKVLYANENIWLPQKRMAELFGCSADNISLHLKNIYKEKELDELSTAEVFSVVQVEGKREVTRSVTCYSLEAIIAVGYRVNSDRGTQFRQWAITILQQYIHKGFAIDNDRFKYGSRFSTRFFDDLLVKWSSLRLALA